MAYKISECTDDDISTRLVDIIFDSMHGRNNLINAIRQHNMTSEGRERARQGYLRMNAMDPSVRWFKATDSQTDEMIGVAMWNVYRDSKPPEKSLDGPPGTWDTEEDKEYAVAMFESFIVYRRKVLREANGPVICLSIMAVDDEHQRRGVGTSLMRWGIDIADELDAECTVESTDEGRRLYERAGFVSQSYYLLEVPEKFKNRPQQHLTFMRRPKKTESY